MRALYRTLVVSAFDTIMKYRSKTINAFFPTPIGDAEADPCDVNVNENCVSIDKLKSRTSLGSVGPACLSTRRKSKTRNAYMDNHGTFEHAMKLVATDEEQQFVNKKLNEMTEGLYRFKVAQGIPTTEGLASLPRLEKAPKRINLANK